MANVANIIDANTEISAELAQGIRDYTAAIAAIGIGTRIRATMPNGVVREGTLMVGATPDQAQLREDGGKRYVVNVRTVTVIEPTEPSKVTVEIMPEHLRASHRAARNWGVYPHNGATREEMTREEAEELCEGDEYNHIVRT